MPTFPWTRGAETARQANTTVPAAGMLAVTNEGNVYAADGATPWSAAKRLARASEVTALIPALEGVRAYSYGNSYGNGAAGAAVDIITAFPYRFANRHRTQALIDNSVSGTRSDQIQAKVASTWTAPGRGLVLLPDIAINDAIQGSSSTTTRECFRSILAHLTALYIAGITDTSIQFGPNWVSGVASTAGSYADHAFVGDAVYIRYGAVTTGGGTFTVTDTAGTVKATTNTTGFSQPFTGVVKVAGFGAGNHTVRVAAASGTVTLAGTIVPSTIPPLIMWFKPAGVPYSNGIYNTALAAGLAACTTILNDFPSVVPVATDSNYNAATMITSDGLHLNDLGNAYVADLFDTALATQTYLQGLNKLTIPSNYSNPSSTYTRPGATVPATVTGFTATTGNQVSFTWNAVTDGGATLTGYIIEQSTDGTTWTTATTTGPALTTALIISGLTSGTSYQFRIKATNSVGNSTPSATSAATAGNALVIYSADPLTGTGAMGTVATGGQSWFTISPCVFGRTAAGAKASVPATGATGPIVDDGQSNGTFNVTMGFNPATGVMGLSFDCNAAYTTGYLFWCDSAASNQYKLSKRTAQAAFTTVATSTTAGAINDVLTVVKNGSSIVCKVNGTTVITATDATYSGTCHGPWSYTGTTVTFTNWQHIA